MSKLKQKVKKDLESNIDIELSIDTSNLEPNKEKVINKKRILKYASLGLATSLILVVFIPLLSMMSIKPSVKEIKKRYSINEVNLINNSSFNKLNNIEYPNGNGEFYAVSKKYQNSVKDFAYNVFKNLETNDDNFSFSPLSLYSNLNIISLASNNENVIKDIDQVLGMNEDERKDNFKKMYQTNYFSNEQGTIQMYNAVFQSNKWDYNQEFIVQLSDYYAEAYSMDFNNEAAINMMLYWIDQRMSTDNFFSKEDLDIDEYTAIYFLSTLYFNNTWANKFLTNDTYEAKFKNIDGTSNKISYMNHKSFNDVYEYEDYYSIYDSYKNHLKIQYLLPKNEEQNIFDLLKDKNFLIEDLTKIKEKYIIDLSVPKFESTSAIDFTSTMKNIGLNSLFEPHSIDGAFENIEENGFSLKWIKQKNKISFNESGTVIKSLTISAARNSEVMERFDTLEINLNRPFVYVIYDANNLPLYIGSISNL